MQREHGPKEQRLAARIVNMKRPAKHKGCDSETTTQLAFHVECALRRSSGNDLTLHLLANFQKCGRPYLTLPGV